VNDVDSYESLVTFVEIVSRLAGVTHFIIHARKAILNKNFSPADNRNIPPLRYDYVYRLVADFPHLQFTLNGGVKTYADVSAHLKQGVVGVMVGRSVVDDPFYWSRTDALVYGSTKESDPLCKGKTRREVLQSYIEVSESAICSISQIFYFPVLL
jgi:tRNA-dihydrouridine synthase A